jgi:hypothetical protein
VSVFILILRLPFSGLDYSFIQVILRVGTDTYEYRFFGRMKGVLDTLTLYTLENGLITWSVQHTLPAHFCLAHLP